MLNKLKLNKEFRRVYGRGKSFVDPGFVTYIMRTKSNDVRLGITVSKKFGTAVKRNRAKRIITAAFRSCYPNISKGNDIVIVARSRILSYKSNAVADALTLHLKSANVWTENDQ